MARLVLGMAEELVGLGVSRQGGRIGAVTAVGWGILTSKADVGVYSKGELGQGAAWKT